MKPSFLRLMIAAVALSVAAPAMPALAQKKKAAQKKSAPAAKAPARKEEAKPADPEERKGPAAFQAAPRSFDARKEEAADKKRDEAIEALKRIIPRIEDGSPQKADLLFQLAEMYWEKQKFLALKANAKYSKDIEAANEAMNRGEKVPDPKLDLRESELYRSETMRLYETILRDYPSYHRKDEVLFALGYNLYELNKRKEAVARYEELTKNYPDSRFVADTYVQLANHWFDNNDLMKAKTNYEKALKTENAEIYGYALYKLAWCDYNAGEYEAGLKKFHDVVEFSEKQGKGGAMLKSEALRDMVLTYVQLNRPDDAVAYFKRKAPKNRQGRLTAGLANGLADAGYHESAIKVFRGLINDEPNRAEAPDYQQSIIRSYEKLRQRDQVRAEVKKLAELYRPGSVWWKANESRPTVLKSAFEVTEEAMRSVVTEYHQEAQKTRLVATYFLARDIYKEYIDSFATSEDPQFVSDHAFNMLYYYSDILWALEEWPAAAQTYERVLTFKVPDRDLAKELANEKFRLEAGYNAILAYTRLMRIEKGELPAPKPKKPTEYIAQEGRDKKKDQIERNQKVTKRTVKELEQQKLSKLETKLVEVCDLYNQLFPDNRDEIDVRYQAAVIFYDRNHFVEAGRRFAGIINKWPEEKRSREAADLTMAVLEETEEWLELNKVSRTFLANKKLTARDAAFARRVAGVVEGSQYKYVDEVIYKSAKNEAEKAKAAEMFLEFVKEFPKSDNADRALTYAMLIFQEAEQLDRGIEIGERLLAEYVEKAKGKESPFELKARYALAKFYEQTAQYKKSAQMYQDFIRVVDETTLARKGGKLPKGVSKRESVLSREELKALLDEATNEDEKDKSSWLSNAHFNAALWWEGLGEFDKAIAAWNAYMTRFPKADDVPNVHFNVALILERQGKWADAIKQLEGFNKSFEKDKRTVAAQHYRSKYRQWKAHKELKNESEMRKLQTELVRAYAALPEEGKKDRRVINGFANMRFLDSETQWKQYTDIKFTKVSTLRKDFAAKQKKIQEIEKMYTDLLAIGDGEFGIAALTRIGLAYADFAKNIIDSPDPKGLDDEQLDMYRSELENMAFPLEEKAIEALEKATDKAYELSIYNEWTLLAQDQMNRYRPGHYARPVPVDTFQGSEFFVVAPVEKEFRMAKPTAPAQPAEPAKPAEKAAEPTTAPTAAAGGR